MKTNSSKSMITGTWPRKKKSYGYLQRKATYPDSCHT